MKKKNNIFLSILLSLITFLCIPAIAKDCQKDVIVLQDKSTGYITNCMTGKRMDDLEKRMAQLDESMKLYFDQILSTSNQIVRKIEKVDKNQIKTEKFLISMREKILDATELAKSDKGAAIEKLAIESIQTNRKLENTVTEENKKLSPELVEALSNFNFARANEIMDKLDKIDETTRETLDVTKETLSEVKSSNNPETAKTAYPIQLRKYNELLDKFKIAKGNERCSKIFKDFFDVKKSAETAASRGRFQSAVDLLEQMENELYNAISEIEEIDSTRNRLEEMYKTELSYAHSELQTHDKELIQLNNRIEIYIKIRDKDADDRYKQLLNDKNYYINLYNISVKSIKGLLAVNKDINVNDKQFDYYVNDESPRTSNATLIKGNVINARDYLKRINDFENKISKISQSENWPLSSNSEHNKVIDDLISTRNTRITVKDSLVNAISYAKKLAQSNDFFTAANYLSATRQEGLNKINNTNTPIRKFDRPLNFSHVPHCK